MLELPNLNGLPTTIIFDFIIIILSFIAIRLLIIIITIIKILNYIRIGIYSIDFTFKNSTVPHNALIEIDYFNNENMIILVDVYLIQMVYVLIFINIIKTKLNQIKIKRISQVTNNCTQPIQHQPYQVMLPNTILVVPKYTLLNIDCLFYFILVIIIG